MKRDVFLQVINEPRNGANAMFRHPLCPWFAISDGVRELADTGCWWLIDICATELPLVFKRNELDTALIKLNSSNGMGKLSLLETEDHCVWEKIIGSTDLPDGEFLLYLAHENWRKPTDSPFRMILASEY